jgi:SAM-dependent methyltransferase
VVRAPRRTAVLARLGVGPTAGELVRDSLDRAFAGSGNRDGEIAVLDAGCGRASALTAYRARIGRFVGADIHTPAPNALPHLDEFAAVDLCAQADAFPSDSFDVILSSFTMEHFADPPAALRNLRCWLKPGGTLVLSTVNRRHPFVWAYLAIPQRVRRPLQRLVKASAADAHPIVGACNDPAAVRAALEDAGFSTVEIRTTGHLARAWGRHLPTSLLGLLGDLGARSIPSRRSTIVAEAVAP